MKQMILLLVAGHCSLAAFGQEKAVKSFTADKDLSRWVIDVNLLGGGFHQQMDMANTAPNYLNGINVNTGNARFKSGGAFGGDLQVGYFFGNARHWGVGTGILYLRQSGNIALDGFHAEYQSVDGNGFTFRQVVSSNGVNEQIRTDNFNIPLVLKYKNRLSKHWGFTADAGALFNVKAKNSYTTNAAFDYEAIYKFVTSDAGVSTPVYDNAATPDTKDFLITRNQFTKNNPDGSVGDYFKAKRDAGYYVGLGVNPDQQKGTASFEAGSVGFLFQPSLNYFFSDRVALNVGGYFLYQTFKNEGTGTYTMTGKPGEYNAVVNSVTKVRTQSFGGNVGLRFFLGKGTSKNTSITSIDQYNPSMCGTCDGSFALHGLNAGDKASVSYTVNGAGPAKVYSSIVSTEGTVTVPALCAGSYTDIKATVNKKTANSSPVNLFDPKLVIGKVASEDPTAPGKCDGTISFGGLPAGQKVTITYSVNSVKSTYTNVVSADNSIKLTGLCAGTISGVMVANGKCVAQLTDPSSIVLVNPTPVAIPTAAPEEDAMSQILFDFNTSDIRPVSYPILDRAVAQLQKDDESRVIIDGNTDKIGTDEYNQKLSERRANAVKAYLVNKGISESRIANRGNGEREPVATNNTAEGRSKNRRAEILIKIKK